MKPIIKLFNRDLSLVAMIDDWEQASFEHNLYSAGAFTITINYNIPNARLFQRGLFVQFGESPYDFGEIITVSNSIGPNGKGSEYLNVTGYDARYLFKRRIIKNLNSNDTWSMTAKGELCMRNLVADQCGINAETKRQLPINNTIPEEADALGSTYSVSESYSNLYDVLCTIATQSEIGWAVTFNGSSLNLVVFNGTDKSSSVFFSTDFESLSSGNYSDSSSSFANSVYIGGKGTGSERDIYEGEVDSPEGLDRFEAFDNQSSMTTEEEYEAEAESILSQYGQTISMNGQGLVKSPYVFRSEYNIGDIIKLSFSGKSANIQILSVTEAWTRSGGYALTFSFGKPVNTLDEQLNIILRKIQEASSKTSSTDSVKWYTTPTETTQDKSDVTFNTLGFTGSGGTFTLYLDDEKTGSKSYHLYIKNLTSSLVLTTGRGATDLTLTSGSYIANIFVDEDGNIINQGMTATNSVESGNTQPVTSDGVSGAIENNKAVNYLGVCDTASSTAEKIVICANWNGFAGQSILIAFTNANTANNPTLNINGKGALPIYNGSTQEDYIPEGNILLIVNSDRTQLQVVNIYAKKTTALTRTESSDANTAYTNGLTKNGNNTTNSVIILPGGNNTPISSDGFIINNNVRSSFYGQQMAYDINVNLVFVRQLNNGAWRKWESLNNSRNISTPNNVTTYIKLNFNKDQNGVNSTFAFIAVYNRLYCINSVGIYRLMGETDYGITGYYGEPNTENNIVWLRISGYRELKVFSDGKVTIDQRTTTNPGYTWNAPVLYFPLIKHLTSSEYAAVTKNSFTLYYITDSTSVYLGTRQLC